MILLVLFILTFFFVFIISLVFGFHPIGWFKEDIEEKDFDVLLEHIKNRCSLKLNGADIDVKYVNWLGEMHLTINKVRFNLTVMQKIRIRLQLAKYKKESIQAKKDKILKEFNNHPGDTNVQEITGTKSINTTGQKI